MHTTLKFDFHLVQFRLQPIAYRLRRTVYIPLLGIRKLAGDRH